MHLNKQMQIMLASLCLAVFLSPAFSAVSLLPVNPNPYELFLHSGNNDLKQDLLLSLKENRDYLWLQNPSISKAKLSEADIDLLIKVLRARAYYEGAVSFEFASQPGGGGLFKYHIIEGPRYYVNEVDFSMPKYLPSKFNFKFGLKNGDPLLAESVLSEKNKLQKSLEELCLLDVDLRHKVLLSKSNHTGRVRFTLKKTLKTRIQTIKFSGLQSVDEKYFRQRLQIKPGDCFSRSDLEQARIDLLQTNLLGKVDIVTKVEEDENQAEDDFSAMQVTFKVEERKHKTVKFGVGYSTDERGGLRVGWEHRNLIGSGENLKVEVGANNVRQYLNGNYRIRDFILTNQDLNLKTELKKETTDAFESSRAKSSAIVSRKFKKNLLGDVGLAFSHSQVLEDEIQERFNLLSVPLRISIEARNNLLDPSSGWHATTSLTPFTDLAKTDVRFLQWTANGSVYFYG